MSRLRQRLRQDGGYSLAELMVVIVLFSMIGGVVATVASTGLHKQVQVQDRNDAMAQARTAQQRISRDVRSADKVEYATATTLILLEAQTSSSWSVTYNVVADGSKYDLTATRSDQPGVTITLLRNVVGVTASPVFKYGADPNYTTTSTSVDTGTCAVSGTSPQQYAQSCIGTVFLDFHIQPSTLTQPVELSDSGTELRNDS